jgi:hypothetical protein
MGIPRGSTHFISDSISPASLHRQLTQRNGVIYARLKTSVSLALFPELLGDVSVLYDLLTARLRHAVFSGNLTHTIQRLSMSSGSAATLFAVCTNLTIGAMQEIAANYNPSKNTPQSPSSNAVSTTVLPVLVTVVIVGTLVLALFVYYVRRYFKKSSIKYRNAKEITGSSLDIFPNNSEPYLIDDIDLDKLNYIADISDVQR